MKWGVFIVLAFILASCQAEILTVSDVADYAPRPINYSDPGSIVAVVNGEELTVGDVASSAIRYGAQPTVDIYDELLEGLVLARLATQNADPIPDSELDSRIDEIAGNLTRDELEAVLGAQGLSIGLIKERIREEIALRSLIDRDVVAPSDEEVREFYSQNAAAFVTPERVVIRHFFVSNESKTPERQLEILQGYINATAEERCAYVEEFTDDRSSADPEVCGLVAISRGTALPELEFGAYGTPPGATQIVQSRFGTHIITGQGIVPAASLSLEEAQPRIRQILTEREQVRVADRALSSLLEDATITIYFAR